MKASDTQVGGGHYKDMAIEPSYFIEMNKMNWCAGNIIKYTCRHATKNGEQDIRKAIHYCELLMEWKYFEDNTNFNLPNKAFWIEPVRFVEENKLPPMEGTVVFYACYDDRGSMISAIKVLKLILKRDYNEK